ncbi:MAG: hypothetical protein UHS41_06090 [Lachnospiraceae bacterium]|nr:hypothetical protein [Lachnospiraceae bacterium]
MRKSFLDEKYRPTGESILKESKISVFCGVLGLLVYGILVWISFKNQGNAGKYLGFLGWMTTLAAGIGEYFAYLALQQPGGKMSVKILGLLANSILILILFIMFIIGF